MDVSAEAVQQGSYSKTKKVAAAGQLESLRCVLADPLHGARHHVLAALLQEIDEVLTSRDVPYWLSGGTLIGALRHGNIIPHDDDVDIECLAADLPRLSAAISDGMQQACVVKAKLWFDAEVYRICKRVAGRTFLIDVFPRPEGGAGDAANSTSRFPSVQEVFPLARCRFAGVSVSIPGDVSVLERLYGPRWKCDVHVWGHSSGAENEELVAPLLPVDEYNDIVASMGYVAPQLEATSQHSWSSFSEPLAMIHAARCRELSHLNQTEADALENQHPYADETQLQSKLSESEHCWRQTALVWLLNALDEKLTEEGIIFWASGRTLLGALRYGSIIPYDSVIALECFEDDYWRLVAVARTLAHVCDRTLDERCHITLYDVDIEVRVDARPRDVSESLPPPVAPRFSETEILPLRRLAFCGTQIPCPASSESPKFLACYEAEQPSLAACDALIASAGCKYERPLLVSWDELAAPRGPLERFLWERLGWASPLGPVMDDDDDD
eukprot:TRINITY_DN12823_c0_g1_i1.p1 TRINITY_DN12823_c0_g1~~TRINITY_DN12823_c0_g1_i1.p1  ORF type:complete len:519 (-),score=62.63 TRINITY_DN12823_c0_g1_i1:283-1779(-)